MASRQSILCRVGAALSILIVGLSAACSLGVYEPTCNDDKCCAPPCETERPYDGASRACSNDLACWSTEKCVSGRCADYKGCNDRSQCVPGQICEDSQCKRSDCDAAVASCATPFDRQTVCGGEVACEGSEVCIIGTCYLPCKEGAGGESDAASACASLGPEFVCTPYPVVRGAVYGSVCARRGTLGSECGFDERRCDGGTCVDGFCRSRN